MRFESATYLYLLSIIPIFVLVMMWAEWHRKRMLRRLGDKSLVRALMPDTSAKRRWIKFLFLMLAYALAVFMLARHAGTPTDGNQGVARETQRHRGDNMS